jgi:hypothetical protein
MAIGAFLTYVREHQLDMAAGARNFFVHSAERVSCFIVLKFRNAPDGLPTERRMTVFARNGQRRAVRITSNLFLRRTAGSLSMKLKGSEKHTRRE